MIRTPLSRERLAIFWRHSAPHHRVTIAPGTGWVQTRGPAEHNKKEKYVFRSTNKPFWVVNSASMTADFLVLPSYKHAEEGTSAPNHSLKPHRTLWNIYRPLCWTKCRKTKGPQAIQWSCVKSGPWAWGQPQGLQWWLLRSGVVLSVSWNREPKPLSQMKLNLMTNVSSVSGPLHG